MHLQQHVAQHPGADVDVGDPLRLGPEQDFFANLMEAWENAWPKPRIVIMSFPHNPTTTCVDLAWMTRVVDERNGGFVGYIDGDGVSRPAGGAEDR